MELTNTIIIDDTPYPTAWFITCKGNTEIDKGFWLRCAHTDASNADIIDAVFSRGSKYPVVAIERRGVVIWSA